MHVQNKLSCDNYTPVI